MPQVQFQSVKQKQIPVQRRQKKIEISQLQLAQEIMRSKIGRMTLEKTEERDALNQAVVRIVNEAARAWSIECLRHEIQDIIPLAWAMEMQAEYDRGKREEILQKRRRPTKRNQSGATEINKIGTVLNNSCQFKIQTHMLNRNRSSQDITVVHDVTSKESFNKVKV